MLLAHDIECLVAVNMYYRSSSNMNKFRSVVTFLVLYMSVFAEGEDDVNAIKSRVLSFAFVETGFPENIKGSYPVTVILINKSENKIALSRDIEAFNVSKNGIPIVHIDYGRYLGEFIDVDPGKALKIKFLLKKHHLDVARGKQADIVIRSFDRISKQESTEAIRVEIVEVL